VLYVPDAQSWHGSGPRSGEKVPSAQGVQGPPSAPVWPALQRQLPTLLLASVTVEECAVHSVQTTFVAELKAYVPAGQR